MGKPKIIETHIVENTPEQVRLQEYGVGIFYEIPTKSSLKKAIKKNRILVNGTVATTALFIHKGDVIELKAIDERPAEIYRLNLKVHFEDDYLAIVEKPAGISVSGNKFSTIQNALEPHLTYSTQSDATYPHAVHRLDYPTSGLLIVGKTASTRRILHQMFAEHLVRKTYHAVTVGMMNQKCGTINQKLEGKTAITDYKVIKSIASEKFEGLNLVQLHPKTGRMHQLRKHLLLIGHPIMGDQKYYLAEKKHQGNGLYLHASALCFTHPILNIQVNILSELPKKFKRLFPLD